MAELLWGKVYYQNAFAGFLRQEPGFGCSFKYDEAYLSSGNGPISQCLPLQNDPIIYQTELPPFFDNLVAEGWLEEAQRRLLGKRFISRFELILAFGQDCAGAVSIVDPSPEKLSNSLLNIDDPKEMALLTSRASLSGVQPKLAVVEKNGNYYPATTNELSTYIAKFPSHNHKDLIANEYITTLAFNKLLPEDRCVDMQISQIDGFNEQALIIKRFDRHQGQRIHFEEFNQLFDYPSNNKYFGSYKDMADFIHKTPDCLPTEIYRLYLRILAGFLLGNTDMHLKNFAMFHLPSGLRLTPSYDQVAAAIYGYSHIALAINDRAKIPLHNLTSQDIIKLGTEFGLHKQAILMATTVLAKNFASAKQSISQAQIGSTELKASLINLMDKIWNKTFVSIGQS